MYFPKSIRSGRIVLQSLTATSNFYRQNSRIRFGKQAEFSRPANSTHSSIRRSAPIRDTRARALERFRKVRTLLRWIPEGPSFRRQATEPNDNIIQKFLEEAIVSSRCVRCTTWLPGVAHVDS